MNDGTLKTVILGHHHVGGGLLLLCLSILPSSLTGADCGSQIVALPNSKQEFVAAGEFPWVVSLRDLHNKHIAIGCILSEYWIVSVASSFQNRSQIFAMADVTDLKSDKSITFPISTVFFHKDFDEITLAHNIVLLKTANSLEFSETIQPICFLHQDFPASALMNCVVAGWLNPHSGRGSLRKLSMDDVDPCPLQRTMSTECSSHREGDNAAGCLGDPGNPIMCQAKETGHWVLKGVLTEGGARCYGPFLYTRLSYYSDWIVITTAKGRAPISPSLGSRHLAIWTLTEEPRGAPEPILASRVLNFSDASEDLPLSADAELQQGSTELFLNGSAKSQGRSEPIYYDYYNGELLPISTAKKGQPQGLIAVSLLLHLLGCSITA
ncbi:inactive serine protease 54 [Heteronotia binoei]|uniref:inactive serine protease 54 n=1 Tax=Heteronotia binoei TaxID=13085 RepID=UPI00292D0D3A|nr:inactive serine protease 54 [Heteronotia binoei]